MKMMKKVAQIIYHIGRILMDIVILSTVFVVGLNIAVTQGTKSSIVQPQEITTQFPYVVVLGASVQGLQLSPILQDRIETAIQLYNNGKTKKILISGDNIKKRYNEVDAMYRYLRNRGIPADAIITDIYGTSTFASIVHTKEIMGALGETDIVANNKQIGVITQNFHLPRALFIAQAIGLDTVGISSDRASYAETKTYITRERFATIKAFLSIIRYYIH